MPRNTARAPTPICWRLPPGLAKRPSQRNPAPASRIRTPMIVRRRDVRSLSIPRSRMAATGAMVAALRAGKMAATTVMPVPTSRAEITAEGGTLNGVSGPANPMLRSRALRPMASPMPATTPMAEAPRPTTNASSSTERSTWRPAGPDGPQQGELAGALGDDDRERVVDDERAHEQGDQGERQQERVEDGDQLLERVLALGGELGAGDRLVAGRQDLGDAGGERGLRDARRRRRRRSSRTCRAPRRGPARWWSRTGRPACHPTCRASRTSPRRTP